MPSISLTLDQVDEIYNHLNSQTELVEAMLTLTLRILRLLGEAAQEATK